MKLPERPDLSGISWQRALRLGPMLAWGLALAVTAWVAADLFWRFSAPSAPALPVASLADPQAAAQAIASRHLMGQAAAGSTAAAPVQPGRYALQAVVTGSGKRPGWAVISVDGGAQQGIVEGQEVRPGVTLALVKGDSVELSIGGARQTIRLAERAGIDGSAPIPAPASAAAAQNPGGGASVEPAPHPFPGGFPVQNLPVHPTPDPSNQ
ncbi:MAG: hypothetical protein IPQ01_10000 [Zoogloea sp.]|nr:hypothetical protein [Zoogloea sp.]